ncbi:hypothetical protein [Streptomyces sp. NPDC059994]|uniref:hypothetical protein n=1 Tax=Streptomyces sp. NPDC059994 TaxID=3347029 RepID=UPI003677F3C0
MTTAVREAPHHRNLTCYTDYRCRRSGCVRRYLDWDRDRIARHADGSWDNLVDAAPVRQHLLALEAAGVLPNRIAKATGIPLQTIRDFTSPRTRGRRYRTSPERAAKILAITADDTTPLYVDPTGTHRRIQALVAAGWPLIYIDRRLGYKRERMRKILAEKTVLGTTEELIATTYEQLSRRKPECNGVSKQYARQARKRAAANRWPTPKYWDQYPDGIDDPHFEPMYGRTRGELLAADGRELLAHGVHVDQAAKRLGVTRQHLQQALVRHPQPETELAV